MAALVGSDHAWERIPPRNGSLAMRCTTCRTVWLCHERKPRRACKPTTPAVPETQETTP